MAPGPRQRSAGNARRTPIRKHPRSEEPPAATHPPDGGIIYPSGETAFKALLSARFCAAIWSNISDCDETYNYWEPSHYMLYGKGFQTWEYSPEFALRSYTYLLVNIIPAWFYSWLFQTNRLLVFYFSRCLFGLMCALCEVYFYKSICREFGIQVGRLTLTFLIFSAGMFISSTAFLPSSFSMYMCLLSMGAWFQRKYELAIWATALSAILSWPFAGLLGVPIALDMLFRKKHWLRFFRFSVLSAAAILPVIVYLDSSYYGRFVMAPFNIVRYNVLTSHGPDLYGTEPWTFYFVNTVLNFNLIAVGAMFTPVALVVLLLCVKSQQRHPLCIPYYLSLMPLYLWCAVFFFQPHKEERFLFPVYPLICLCGAVTVDIIQKIWFRIWFEGRASSQKASNPNSAPAARHYLQHTAPIMIAAMLLTSLLGLSRILTLYKGYHAPMDVLMELHRTDSDNDLGWNDVGFHGSPQIPTPNLDALAFSGRILMRHYVTPLCTPTRVALLTGRHPAHNGMQHRVIYGAEPRGLPLNERLLPQYLSPLGYHCHIVGKWHLGHFRTEYTPTHRGFLTHVGPWTGHHDYFDHTAVEGNQWGLDMRRGLEPAWDLHGKYSTDVIAEEAVARIDQHNASHPLFLYVAHVAPHSGNPYNPIPARDEEVEKMAHISEYQRRRYAAAVHSLDESVGKIVEALAERDMLRDTLILFSNDNGGAAAGFNINAASNWPLRGVKNTLWEGGVRGATALWGGPKWLKGSPRLAGNLMHVTDWLPTFLSAAGASGPKGLDGIDQWRVLSGPEEVEEGGGERSEVLHNIDPIIGNAALTVDRWKLVTGTSYEGTWDGWYGPSGRADPTRSYDVTSVMDSRAGKAVRAAGAQLSPQQILDLRRAADVGCDSVPATDASKCAPLVAPCLFNVHEDPCEKHNVADRYPTVLQRLMALLADHNRTVVYPTNVPLDPRGNPDRWNHVWSNFGDDPAHTETGSPLPAAVLVPAKTRRRLRRLMN